MYDVHIEVESLVYIYVYVGSRTIFFPVLGLLFVEAGCGECTCI